MYDLYSFDIFDTLITRKTAIPKGIFALMQNKIRYNQEYKDFPSDIKENFFEYRVNSEFHLRKINNTENIPNDITIDEIYDSLKYNFCLTSEQAEKLKELEIQTEIENLIPIEANIEKLTTLVNEGKRVVLVSDMYLSSKIIKEILSSINPVFRDIKLYLSCECGCMKSKGGLFEFVKQAENIEYSKWYHFGDNKQSDYNIPLRYGIKAELYEYVQLKEYEKNALDTFKSNPFIQLAVGCCKNIRLHSEEKNEKFELGMSLAGVMFFPFINWLLGQAQKRSLNCLYFVARDGYVLKQMADILIEQNKLNIKTEYLYGSKKAWRTAALDINNKELNKQFITSLLWTHKKIDEVCNVTVEELCKILPKEFHNFKKGLKPSKVLKLKEFLLNSDDFIRLVSEKNADKKVMAAKYLKQEISKNQDKNIAFVDIDGSGFTQNCMSSIIKTFTDKELTSFYIFSTPASFIPINIKTNYFSALKKPMLGHIIELLARAPHGQTLGYKENGSYTEPVLEEINPELIKEWKFDDYVEGIKEFTCKFNEYVKAYPEISFDSQIIINQYVKFIVEEIDEETANLLGNITHSLTGEEKKEFAPVIDCWKALKYLFSDKIETENILFSKMRSKKFAQNIIDYKKLHPSFRKEIVNVLINKKKKEAEFTLLGIKWDIANIIWKDKI